MEGINRDERLRLVEAAMEVIRQRTAGTDLRCDCCGFYQQRWELDSWEPDATDPRKGLRLFRDGRELLRCSACAGVQRLGLDSRLEIGRVPVGYAR